MNRTVLLREEWLKEILCDKNYELVHRANSLFGLLAFKCGFIDASYIFFLQIQESSRAP